MALTERQVKALAWEGKDRLVSSGDGLFLNVREHSKTWLMRRQVNGKMQVRTLGKWPRMPALEARALALKVLLEDEPSEQTVKQLAERYYADVVEPEHERPELVRGYLDRAVLPGLGTRRVVEIAPAEVAKVISE